MNEAVFLLYLLNLAYIGALPRIFFKKGGRLGLMWWLTALPFLVCSLALILAFAGYLKPFGDVASAWRRWLALASVLFSAVSIALISYARGSHRIPISLWHQSEDAPANIVTYGAYNLIRHPFYAAFLLALSGASLFCPHALTLFAFAYGCVILNVTAAREERRLAASALGAEYREYLSRTGRFLPKIGRARGVRD
jgi:protein-S-isoprenylcysteine O-methyltransferase Ste14